MAQNGRGATIERLLMVAAGLVCAGALWGTFSDGISRLAARDVRGRPPIASIAVARNDVRSRPAEIPGWEDVGTGYDLHVRDHVYTGAGSGAELAIKDGARIAMVESSLIVLDLEHSAPAVDVRRGVVRIAAEDSLSDVNYRVRGISGTFKSGSSEAIVAVNRDGSADLVVLKGDTTLKAADGTLHTVKALEKSRISGDGGVAPVERVSIVLKSPVWDDLRFTGPGGVEFSWDLLAAVNGLTLEIAGDPEFRKIEVARPVGGTSAVIGDLTPGTRYWRVRGAGAGDGRDTSSGIHRLRLAAASPPRIVRPVAGERFNAGGSAGEPGAGVAKALFEWSRPPESVAFDYEIRGIDDERPGAPPVRGAQDFPGNSSVITDLPPGSYRFHVWAKYPGGRRSAVDAVVAFGVAGPAAPVAAPQPVSPSEDEAVDLARVDVVQLVARADTRIRELKFEVSRTRDFAGASLIDVKGTRARWQPAAAGEHYWRVRGVDGLGRTTDYSEPRRLLATVSPPVLMQPDDDVRLALDGPEGTWRFIWAPLVRAKKYRIELSKAPDFVAPEVNAVVADPVFVWTSPLAGRWYWRVSGLGDTEQVLAPSAVRSFEAVDTPPLPPPELAPEQRVLLDWGETEGRSWRWRRLLEDTAFAQSAPQTRAKIRWPAVDGAAQYELEIADETVFDRPLVRQRVDRPEFLWLGARPGKYWYRVRSVDQQGRVGPPSAVAGLIVEYPGPVLLGPVAGTRVKGVGSSGARVTLKWRGLPHASGYRVEISRDAAFSAMISRPAAAERHDAVLERPGLYFWRVVGLLESGAETRPSQVWQIEVEDPQPAPRLISPEPGAKLQAEAADTDLRVTFVWSPPPGGVACRLAVAEDERFSRSLRTVQVSGDRAVIELPAGRWHWRVRCALDEAQDAGWSETSALEVLKAPVQAEPAPNPPRLAEPPVNHLKTTVAATYMQWEITTTHSARTVAGIASGSMALDYRYRPVARRRHAGLAARRMQTGSDAGGLDLYSCGADLGYRLELPGGVQMTPHAGVGYFQYLTYRPGDIQMEAGRLHGTGPKIGMITEWRTSSSRIELGISGTTVLSASGWKPDKRSSIGQVSTGVYWRLNPALEAGASYDLDARAIDGRIVEEDGSLGEHVEIRVADHHAGGNLTWSF